MSITPRSAAAVLVALVLSALPRASSQALPFSATEEVAPGIEYYKLDAHKMETRGSQITTPDLGKVAVSFGGRGTQATTIEHIVEKVTEKVTEKATTESGVRPNDSSNTATPCWP